MRHTEDTASEQSKTRENDRLKEKREEEDDDEDDDEDYVPDKDNEENNSESDFEDDEVKETKKEIKNAQYSKIESTEGGLIKTRNQRNQEVKESNTAEILSSVEASTTVDIDSIWKEMNSKKPIFKESSITKESSISSVSINPKVSSVEQEEEKIKITRTYEYAGETIVEDKWVTRSSAEAKAYLNSLKIKSEQQEQQTNSPSPAISTASSKTKGPKKRKAKKRSIVDSIIGGSKMAKLSTLEKSRLDWANYVDSNKLNDELKLHNKDGFLSKQDFLNEVEHNIDAKIKESKKLSK